GGRLNGDAGDQLVEAVVDHGVAGEIEVRGGAELDEAVVLVGEKADHLAGVRSPFVLLHVLPQLLCRRLQAALDHLEKAIDHGRALAARLIGTLDVLDRDQPVPGNIDLDGNGHRRIGARRAAVGRADGDPAAGNAGVEALQFVDLLPNVAF